MKSAHFPKILFVLCFSSTVVSLTPVPVSAGQMYMQWVARHTSAESGTDFAHDIALDPHGNVYVTGESEGDYLTVKHDREGTEHWWIRYDGPAGGDDRPWAIAVDDSGNVYVTGRSTGIGTNYDCATIKYSPSWTRLWTARYDGPAGGDDASYDGPGSSTDWLHAVSMDGRGKLFVAGYSYGLETNIDYAVIRYELGPPHHRDQGPLHK